MSYCNRFNSQFSNSSESEISYSSFDERYATIVPRCQPNNTDSNWGTKNINS